MSTIHKMVVSVKEILYTIYLSLSFLLSIADDIEGLTPHVAKGENPQQKLKTNKSGYFI